MVEAEERKHGWSVRSDMKDLGLRAVDAKDRELWRGNIFSETSKPLKRGKK